MNFIVNFSHRATLTYFFLYSAAPPCRVEQSDLFVDLWNTTEPAFGRNGSEPSTTPLGPVDDYIEYKFAQYAYNILETYDPNDGPLFLNYDFHIAHLPMQVPTQYFNRFNFMKDGEWSTCVGRPPHHTRPPAPLGQRESLFFRLPEQSPNLRRHDILYGRGNRQHDYDS